MCYRAKEFNELNFAFIDSANRILDDTNTSIDSFILLLCCSITEPKPKNCSKLLQSCRHSVELLRNRLRHQRPQSGSLPVPEKFVVELYEWLLTENKKKIAPQHFW